MEIAVAAERSLVDRARDGDLDAFEQLVRERMDAVYRLTHAIVLDPADAADATQETFVAAWRQIPSLRDPARFDAWLERIAVNAARMTLRSRRRRRVREVAASSAVETLAERTADMPDASLLTNALHQLSPDQRTLLALHHLEGRSVAELAELLEIPVGTVKSRLFTARRALDEALAAERVG
jgi:RNA polymerase sigma-70 factor (ECF subfamily)